MASAVFFLDLKGKVSLWGLLCAMLEADFTIDPFGAQLSGRHTHVGCRKVSYSTERG